MNLARGAVLSFLLLVSCGDERTSDDEVEADAALPDAGATAVNDASAPADASISTCVGADAISQIFCQLLGGGGAQPAGGQADLGALLDILTGLGGQLGSPRDAGRGEAPSGRGSMQTPREPPTERDCDNPADRLTELLCRMRRDASALPPARGDAGPDQAPSVDGGAPLLDSGTPPPDDGGEPVDGGEP
jgi:hypothetical protein